MCELQNHTPSREREGIRMTDLGALRTHCRPGTGRYQHPRLLAIGGIFKMLRYLGEIA